MTDGRVAGALIRREWSPARRAAASLPSDLLEEGARRIRRLQLPGAVVIATCVGVNLWAATRPGSGLRLGALTPAAAAGIVSVLAAMNVITRRSGLDAAWLLDRLLVARVVMSFLLAVFFHSLPADPARFPTSFTPVATWVIATTLFVPSTFGKTTLSTIAAAFMDPVGLALNVVAGAALPPPLTLAGLFLPTALAAALAIVGANVLYDLSMDVAEAREMGSYRLMEVLGRGGMGEVWRAEHRMLARPAAVKLIRPDAIGFGREAVRRFEREARATAALRSPHTVQLYDFGVADDGSFYYAMELLQGFTLQGLVDRFGPLPPERVVHLLQQACRSLAEAHDAGLVHRDVKPSNLFVSRDGSYPDFLKVLDFGLVKDVGTALPTLTASGEALGTPSTMPPEVALGRRDIDGRADLYSLGCVAYLLLSGATVFGKEGTLALIHDHATTLPDPVSGRAAQKIPRELEALVMECLAKDPDQRPPTARVVSARLAAVPLEAAWTEARAEAWWDEYGKRAAAHATEVTLAR